MLTQVAAAKIPYRPDIDGLRSIAVLAVVLFHFFPKLWISGFVGVDVFFVISGFLISKGIIQEIQIGQFAYRRFYQRRIKRIFPALLTLMMTMIGVGWFLLTSNEYQNVGKHIQAAATFTSNFILWEESGYFDQSSEFKPFLHLWSLAIEEQFYLIFPLILCGLFNLRNKFKNALVVGIIIVFCVSFGMNLLTIHNSAANFYFPGARFWELMIGALLAMPELQPLLRPRNYSHFLSYAGLALFIFSLCFIRESTPFPGYAALLPTLAAALVIAAGPNGTLNRVLLSNRLMVWFGKISYPLYLWHWILLVITTLIGGTGPNKWFKNILILISILLAWITYQFIERPIQAGQWRWVNEKILLASLFLLGASGVLIDQKKGFPERDAKIQFSLYEGDVWHDTFNDYLKNKFIPCENQDVRKSSLEGQGFRHCFQSKPGIPELFIVGDSHAEHVFPGMANAFPHINLAYYTKRAIPTDLVEFETIYQFILSHAEVKKVVINAFWVYKSLPIESAILLISKLELAGKEVSILEDVPDFGYEAERCKIRRILRASSTCTRKLADYLGRREGVQEALRVLQKRFPKLHVVYSEKYFCDKSECSMVNGSQLLYRDHNHLNLLGSHYFAEQLRKEWGGGLTSH